MCKLFIVQIGLLGTFAGGIIIFILRENAFNASFGTGIAGGCFSGVIVGMFLDMYCCIYPKSKICVVRNMISRRG